MLYEDIIITLSCIVYDLVKPIGHQEDHRRKLSDSEVITTASVSALYFGVHQDNVRQFMKMRKLVPFMLDKSRLNRCLHEVSKLLFSLFYQIVD